MIRVLHLIHALNVGGLEKRLISLLQHIPRDKVVMDIACKAKLPGVMAPLAEELGAKVYHCRFSPLHLGFGSRFCHIVRHGHYDIVHSHTGALSGLSVYLAHRCGAKAITSFVNSDLTSERKWTSWPIAAQLVGGFTRLNTAYAARNADCITGVSRGVLDTLFPNWSSSNRFRVVYGGIKLNDSPSEEEREELRRELGLPPHAPIILHVGRFSPQKNHLGIISIFRKVLLSVPNARLLLAGTGTLMPRIQEAVAEQGVTEQVLFVGRRDDAPRLMRCSEVLLLPSLFEGLPVVGLEALSSQLPIVASDIPGIRDEVVREGETGFIRPVTDIEGMAKAVVRVLNDPDLARRLGTAGRRLAEANYSIEAAADRYMALYHYLMNSGHDNCDGVEKLNPNSVARI